MTDVIDSSAELEQKMREQALAVHQHRRRPVAGDGYCIDCGDAIPQSRLNANAYAERCIECQQIRELRGRRFA